ncbi:OmpA family protein [Nannocystis pusilla]|uniref:OmpA family protein n=1 Tax=Nannocystis pusilla TaxID=889268 RepID=UPI003BF3212E
MTARTIKVRARLDGSLDSFPLDTGAETRIVVQRPKLHILEVARFSFFGDREILLPDVERLAPDEPGPDRVPGVEVAAAALLFLHEHQDKKLLVVGHTDTVGSKKDNKTLSEDRAKNVWFYLSGDIDGWASHSQKHHTVEDVQSILRWLAAAFSEMDCDPGPVDGDLGPKTRAALQNFRDVFAERAGVEPWTGQKLREDDWRAFAHYYDDAVAARLGTASPLVDIRERAPFCTSAWAGLGEKYPTENPTRDDFDSERNRRVDLVFLDPEEQRFITDEASVEEYLYAPDALVRREWLPIGFPARSDELAVRVETDDGKPITGVECTLTLPGGEVRVARSDARGVVRFFGVPPEAAEFRMPSIEASDWDAIEDAVRPWPASAEQTVDPGDEPEFDEDRPLTPAERSAFDVDDDDDYADDGELGDEGEDDLDDDANA